MTYLELQQAIAGRLNRPELLTPIPPATTAIIPDFVQDRVTYYQKKCFAPSEQLDYSITTIASQNTYPMPTWTQAIRGVRLLLGSIWIPLTRADWYWDMLISDALNPPFVTLPAYWRQFGQAIRLYPTPNIAYPLELMSNASPPAPVDPADSNFWTNEARTLIIVASMVEICEQQLSDFDRADRLRRPLAREEQSMLDYTRQLEGPSQIRSWM